MIVLPGTPPVPVGVVDLPAQLVSQRSSLAAAAADPVRYVVALEEYLEQLCASTAACELARGDVVAGAVPWVGAAGLTGGWSVCNEMELAALAAALSYTTIASQLINELIDEPETSPELVQKWLRVAVFYKKALALVAFGRQTNAHCPHEAKMYGPLYAFVEATTLASLQMLMIAKLSWTNWCDYAHLNAFRTTNNSTLARVAVYVVDELRLCQHLLAQMAANAKGGGAAIHLDYKYWRQYLEVIAKYATAQAGLFLSIEHYQQHRLGQAIGLVNFSLLTLQRKKLDLKPRKLRGLLSAHRNEAFIKKLEAVTTLDIDKSAFEQSSGVVLHDLTYLFDLLVTLHVRFTKENNNLSFDQVVSWHDIGVDPKWPLGSKIPVSTIAAWLPRCVGAPPEPRAHYY